MRLKDGATHTADGVVCNAEVTWAYQNLIPAQYRRTYTDRKLGRLKQSMSLFVIYFGTKRRYTDVGLAHHNIILSDRYKGLLSDIFDRKVLADDFSLYLHMPFDLPRPDLQLAFDFAGQLIQAEPLLDTVLIEPDLARLQMGWGAEVVVDKHLLRLRRLHVGEAAGGWA